VTKPAVADDKRAHSGAETAETKLSNTENSGTGPPENNPSVEAMYAVVSEEHRQKKKMAKLCIQQYDDINLLQLNSQDPAGEGESRMQLSVTMEDGNPGYSRLQHAGPRMSMTKQTKYLHSSLSTSSPQLLEEESGKRNSYIAGGGPPPMAGGEKGYSEVHPMRPRSHLIASTTAGGYSMIEPGKKESEMPPLLPKRTVESTLSPPPEPKRSIYETKPLPGEVESPLTLFQYQTVPPKDSTTEPKQGSGYSVGTPTLSDMDFFGDVMEFHNVQAQEGAPDQQLYEKVK
jgi:hypothetical protein